jgi:hypothetical protein
MKLLSCVRCAGFVNPLSSTCPHCSARVEGMLPLLGRATLAVVGGSALSMTMMACYGSPPCDTTNDADGDGVGTESVAALGCYAQLTSRPPPAAGTVSTRSRSTSTTATTKLSVAPGNAGMMSPGARCCRRATIVTALATPPLSTWS